MLQFLKKGFHPCPPSGLRFQLRRDQLSMLRAFIAFAFLGFTWGLFHNDWPHWLMLALQITMLAALVAGAFFPGRFQIGQRWLLSGLQAAPIRAATDPTLGPAPLVQAYASLDEAQTTGWDFFERVGRYGAWPIPRWAHDGTAWFEFQGLDSRSGMGLRQDERVFGLFVYRQVPEDQQPAHPLPWVPLQPSA